ncbi:hypothetical protein [Legionella sp. km772]|uniref:hypothetical protein n=1 Tax=Legionella sp. km772 TaxID=2498111 RepID=UPI000F8CCE36|nr:hypothetical protein [Legionella sp. km772]RUR08778.1 hypothetical protein ELY15_10185 [Legionella sp. km772]
MQDLTEINNHEELHLQANKYFKESHELLFQKLPALISQIIANKSWDTAYNNFGEYVLDQSEKGLGINNNNLLWLLRSTMDTEGQHAAEWGDVLREVDGSVRAYAKEKNIAVKDLSSRLTISENSNTNAQDNSITYLPSRSKSNDGQLLKLRNQDEQTYNEVVSGKISLKEALPYKEKKPYIPLEFVKTKFQRLSHEDREAFLAWIEEL